MSRAAAKARGQARAQADMDLKAVLSTPEGRRFVWRLVDGVCGLHGPTFTAEPLRSAYLEGRRSVAQDVVRDAQRVAPRLWVEVVAEALEEALRRSELETVQSSAKMGDEGETE